MATAKDMAGEPMKDELDMDDACAFLKIAKQTMYNRIQDGTAPRRFKENGRWKFKRADLESYKRNEREFFGAGQ